MKKITFAILVPVFIFTALLAPAQESGGTTAKNLPDGYGNISWGTMLSDARDKINGKLAYTDERKIILSKDGELQYIYGFFYIDPAAIPDGVEKKEESSAPAGTASPEEKKDEGKLFYVALKFPYIAMDDVKKKLTEKYGESSSENMKDNQGAMAWDSDNTIIIMWVDRYEKKPFCRRITYISKEIAKELNEYQFKVFNKTELEILKKLNP